MLPRSMKLSDNDVVSARTESAPRQRFDAAPKAAQAPSGGIPVSAEQGRPILFVDGCCVLCQRTAGWVARRDRRGRVALAALQGETARRLLPGAVRAAAADGTAGSVVWRTAGGRLLLRSSAVLAAVAVLGGWYRGAVLLRLVPAPLRDALYDVVARRRRRWFGATRECLLPTAAGSVVLD